MFVFDYKEGKKMIVNPVHIFYENNAFENLKETKPFLEYLRAEERKVD